MMKNNTENIDITQFIEKTGKSFDTETPHFSLRV